MSEAPDLQGSLERYRAVRQRLEEEILPLATSVDGRRFSSRRRCTGSRSRPAWYVVLERAPSGGSGRSSRSASASDALELTRDDGGEPRIGA